MIDWRTVLKGAFASAFSSLVVPSRASADCFVAPAIIDQKPVPYLTFLEWQFASYLKRRGNLDQKIADWRYSGSDGDRRITSWIKFMDMVKECPSAQLKAALVNGFCNTIIKYDHKKTDRVGSMEIDWWQTPFDTLSKGRGICGDIAWLKHETLLRVGFSQTNARFVVANLISETKREDKIPNHAIGVVRIGDTRWVLNDRENEVVPRFAEFKDDCFLEWDDVAFSSESAFGLGFIKRPIWATDDSRTESVCSPRIWDSPIMFYDRPPSPAPGEKENMQSQFQRLTFPLNTREREYLQRIENLVIETADLGSNRSSAVRRASASFQPAQ